jgi:hypothetical protein
MFIGKFFLLAVLLAVLADYMHHLGWYQVEDLSSDHQSVPPSLADPSAVEFCSCSNDEVETNSAELLQLLNRIVRRPYFRYYKVNTHKDCPFWAVHLLCTSDDSPCSLCTCDAEEVPLSLRVGADEEDMSDVELEGEHTKTETTELHISSKLHERSAVTPLSIDAWGTVGAPQSSAVASDDDLEYVDLVLNPEANTGYSGPMANRVWEAIYRENCLKEQQTDANLVPKVHSGDVAQCSEFQVLYRLMSGFHASITFNVATNFHRVADEVDPYHNLLLTSKVSRTQHQRRPQEASRSPSPTSATIPVYSPNCEMHRRLRAWPERRINLNFLYQFVLRAVAKAAPILLSDMPQQFHSGFEEEDELLVKELRQLFNTPLLCSATFDDTKFLQSEHAQLLIPEMKKMMRNVSALMDCVSCQKCRLWGKLEAQGIATALKVITHRRVVASDSDISVETSEGSGCSTTSDATLELKRGEKVSLINLLRQLSIAVWSLKNVCQDE